MKQMRTGLAVALAVALAAAFAASPAEARHKARHKKPVVATRPIATVPPGDPNDPTCDLGYPYSGSAPYFWTPTTFLRHTGPLALLLGEHVERPCNEPGAALY
jgi:hypothetical protein